MSVHPLDLHPAVAPARPAARPWRYGRLRGLLPLPAMLLLVLAATVLGYNTPYALTVEASTETRQILFGFHGLERADDYAFRWTNGESRVCLDQIGRVPRSALALRVLGEGGYALGNTSLSLQVNERPIVTAPVLGATRVYHVMLDDALNQRDDDCLLLISRAVTTPSDPRTLGVPFAIMQIRPLAAETPVWPAGAQLGLNLLVALLAYWLLRQVGATPLWSALLVGGAAVALVAAIVAGLLTPGLGLARHMLPLVVGAGAAALFTAVAARLRWRFWRAPLLAFDLAGMALWSLLLVGLTSMAQQLLALGGVWPLKAGFFPALTPLAVLPALAFAAWAWLVLRALDEGRPEPRPWPAAGLVLLGALALPPLLKGFVRGWDTLFATFTDNPYEYIADVPLVGDDPAGFLASFVSIKDQLALHSSTHPPGSILLLWGVERLLGPGPVPASLAAIGLSALAALAGLWVGWRLGGPRVGLLAGAVAAMMPGQLVYAVTSMDGVFNMLLALGAAAFLLALERPHRAWAAALAGLLIALGLFFTYAATQLFFFGVAVAAVAVARAWATAPDTGPRRRLAAALPALRQGAIAAGVIVALYLGLYLATGFNVVEGALRATAINAEVMRGVRSRPFVPPSLAYYTLFLGANLLAFAWYLGPWGLTATTAAGRASLVERPLSGWAALAAGLVALVAGMALGGLFNREVERIWGFTYPLLAVLVARHALQGDGRERRWRAGLYLGLAFAHGLLIRLLLSTFW
ncbi:MAG TPA: hypothetical protein PKD53_28685 [Chloroflexaceae bacterium]|nr:hypothetical protein [Chloroflexaceae bacterium]